MKQNNPVLSKIMIKKTWNYIHMHSRMWRCKGRKSKNQWYWQGGPFHYLQIPYSLQSMSLLNLLLSWLPARNFTVWIHVISHSPDPHCVPWWNCDSSAMTTRAKTVVGLISCIRWLGKLPKTPDKLKDARLNWEFLAVTLIILLASLRVHFGIRVSTSKSWQGRLPLALGGGCCHKQRSSSMSGSSLKWTWDQYTSNYCIFIMHRK